MRRLDGHLAGIVAVCVLFLLAAGAELCDSVKRLSWRLGRLLRPKGAREGQDGYTFV